MNDINHIDLESTPRIFPLLMPLYDKYESEEYKCYLGLIFHQGKRRMIQINVHAQQLLGFLQAKPSLGNDPDSGKNRPVVKGHAGEIKKYIIQRVNKDQPWILGTLTANIDPEDIEIIELGRGVCFVAIPLDKKLDITDGQHRYQAIKELMESEQSPLIARNYFPITLVLEGDLKQCQTDFRDMAQARQLDKSLLLSFGEFSGRIGITKYLVSHVSMFEGKTEKVKKSPATKKKLIYTNNYIVRLVSYAFTDTPNDDLENADVEKDAAELTRCLNYFFNECRDTQYIASRPVDELTIDDVIRFKEKSLLSVSIGLEILGRLLYVTYDKDNCFFNLEWVSQLAELDWSKGSHLWQNNVIRIDSNPKYPNKPYQLATNPSQVRLAVNTVKTHLGWM